MLMIAVDINKCTEKDLCGQFACCVRVLMKSNSFSSGYSFIDTVMYFVMCIRCIVLLSFFTECF